MTIDKIINSVCAGYGITTEELLNHSRVPRFVLPRQIAAYLMYTDLKISTVETARLLRRKNHTTVVHACQKIIELMKQDNEFRNNVDAIRSQLTALA